MPIDMTTTPDDSPMFAPIPSWERNRKRGAFGRRPARVTTTTTETLPGEPLADPLMADPLLADRLDPLAPDPVLADTGFAAQPVYATRTTARRSSGPAMAITAGLVAALGLAAAGWYATQPHESGMAQITPGSPSTTTTASMPSQVAVNDVAAPVASGPTTHVSSAQAPVAKTRKSTTTTTIRTAARAPAARSVDDAGVNASATLPAGPQPYSGTAVNPTPAPVTAAPVESTPAPVEATPAPAPVAPVAPPAVDNPPIETPQ